MRPGLSRWFAAALLVLIPSSLVAQERILSFHSDIEVRESAQLEITETIDVIANADKIKRGIYRDFPTRYKDRLGTEYRVTFEVQSVTRNGASEPWHLEKRANGIRLYIGSKNAFVSAGQHRYQITYLSDGQIGYFDTFDEIYWNVTGNGWDFEIEQASARVNLPVAIDSSDYRIDYYTGPQGSSAKNARGAVQGNREIYFQTTEPLSAREGLTIAVSWPKGIVYEPTAAERTKKMLKANRHWFIAIGAVLALLGWYLFAWFKVGRDPKPGVIIPQYDPPEDVSPAAIHYIRKMSYSDKTFTTAIISLAVKGYLTIKKSSSKFNFTQTGNEVDFSAGEKALAEVLFENGKSIRTSNKNHARFTAAKAAHKKQLKALYHKEYFVTNGLYLVPGLLITLSATILIALSKNDFVSPVAAIIALYVCFVLLHTTFYFLLRAPTLTGRRFLNRTEGLAQYLKVAEGDDLRARYPLDKTPENFERYLPFAFALGIEKTWVDNFHDVLQKIKENPELLAQSNSLHWIEPTQFGAVTSSLSSSLSSQISSASTPPGSSSGSGGGGSSGGGGGGGGGGGW